MFGWKAREAAVLIFLWMIPVTLIFHNPLGLDQALVTLAALGLRAAVSVSKVSVTV